MTASPDPSTGPATTGIGDQPDGSPAGTGQQATAKAPTIGSPASGPVTTRAPGYAGIPTGPPVTVHLLNILGSYTDGSLSIVVNDTKYNFTNHFANNLISGLLDLASIAIPVGEG